MPCGWSTHNSASTTNPMPEWLSTSSPGLANFATITPHPSPRHTSTYSEIIPPVEKNRKLVNYRKLCTAYDNIFKTNIFTAAHIYY